MQPLLQTQIPTTLVMLALAALLFYFMIIRPARRQMTAQKTRQQELRDATHPGVRVMLASGLVGTVQHVGERQMILELAPGVEVTVLKDAISKIMTPDEEDFEYEESEDEAGRYEDGQYEDGDAQYGEPAGSVSDGWSPESWSPGSESQATSTGDEQFAPVIDTEPAEPLDRPDVAEPAHDADRRS